MEHQQEPSQFRQSNSSSESNRLKNIGRSGGWGKNYAAEASTVPASHTHKVPASTSLPPALRSNRQEILVEVYEHERWSRKADGWIPSDAPSRAHWCSALGEPSQAPGEMTPPADFGWVSNWRVAISASISPSPNPTPEKPCSLSTSAAPTSASFSGPPGPVLQDRGGWEYATHPDKFNRPERAPRGEEKWSDRARRRRWIRLARHKSWLPAVTAPEELGQQARDGLKGLVRGRRTVQELCGLLGTRRDSSDLRSKLFSLVDMVRQHGREIEHVLRSLRGKGGEGGGECGKAMGEVKKWRNDLGREQRLFDDVVRNVERRCRSVPLASLPGGGLTPSEASTGPAGAGAAADTGGGSGARGEASTTAGGPGGGGAAAASLSAFSSAQTKLPGPYAGWAGHGRGERSAQEEALLKQLQFQDEEEVMLALAQERELAIREVTSHLVELKDVFSDFAELVQGQQEGVDAVCRNVEVAHAKTEQGYEAILKAKGGQRAGTGGCVLS